MTTPDRHARVAKIFAEAVRLPPGPPREALIAALCVGEDADLRAEVEDLLRADEHASDLDQPVLGEALRDRILDSTLAEALTPAPAGGTRRPPPTAATAADDAEAGRPFDLSAVAPDLIPGFTVIEQIGEGGMGIVYRARQERPRRDVAIKVIRGAFITSTMRRRFEHEGHVLARLQHPGIAQIHEAGAEPKSGSPYLVMEWIDGRPIDTWAATKDLSRRQRIELMIEVCAAVQYAHQRGVIHRDLKPANILVTDEGRPRVLDFGVARVITDEPWTVSPHTVPGQLIGTLPYMSPEQVSGDPDAIDTRTDVYAMGVLLYQLLAGRLPHDVQRTPIPEAVRQICTENPPRLGTIDRSLRGDLEVILGKALARDKDERYASAAELAADLNRYLTGQVILARPPSTLDQLHKLVVRHRYVAAMLMAFLVIILGFAITVMVQSSHIRAQRDLAVGALEEANRQTARAEAVNRILNDALAAVSPAFAPRPDVTVREFLDSTAASISNRFAGAPLDEAQARRTIGRMYLLLGRYADAEPQVLRAIELHTAHLAGDDPVLADSRAELGRLRMHQRQDAEGREELLAALSIHDARGASRSLAVATLMADVAESYIREDNRERAEIWLNDGLALAAEVDQPPTDVTAKLHDLYGGLLRRRGENDRAMEHLETALAIRSRPGADPADLARTRNSLARLHQDLGDLETAVALFEQSVEGMRAVLGRHPDVASMLSDLGNVHRRRGELVAAERCQRSALEIYTSLHPLDRESTATVMANLGILLATKGELAEATDLLRQSLDHRLEVQTPDHSDVLVTQTNLANVLARQERYEESIEVYAEVAPRLCAKAGERAVDCIAATFGWGQTLLRMQRYEEALPLLEQAVRVGPEVMPAAHNLHGLMFERLGACLQGLDRPSEAGDALTTAWEAYVRAETEAGPNARRVLDEIVRTLTAEGRADDAAAWQARKVPPPQPTPPSAAEPGPTSGASAGAGG